MKYILISIFSNTLPRSKNRINSNIKSIKSESSKAKHVQNLDSWILIGATLNLAKTSKLRHAFELCTVKNPKGQH